MPRRVTDKAHPGRIITVPDDASDEEVEELLAAAGGPKPFADNPLSPEHNLSTPSGWREAGQGAHAALVRTGIGLHQTGDKLLSGALNNVAPGSREYNPEMYNAARQDPEAQIPATPAGVMGSMAGSAAPAIALGALAPVGAGVLGTTAADAAIGAGMGAVEDPENAATGAMTGAAMGAGGSLVARGVSNFGGRQIKASENALLRMQSPKNTTEAINAAEGAVPSIKSEGLLSRNPFRNSTEDVLSRARAARSSRGARVTEEFQKAQTAGTGLDVTPVENILKTKIEGTKIPGTERTLSASSRDAAALKKQLRELDRVRGVGSYEDLRAIDETAALLAGREAGITSPDDKIPLSLFEKHRGDIAPEAGGSGALSNEELSRAARKEVYYKVNRDGSLTYQGPQPDSSRLKPGEGVVKLLPGQEPMVTNASGPDSAILTRFNGSEIGREHAASLRKPVPASPQAERSMTPEQARALRQSLDQGKYNGTTRTRSTAPVSESEVITGDALRSVINEQMPSVAPHNEAYHNLGIVERNLADKAAREKVAPSALSPARILSMLRGNPSAAISGPGALTSTRGTALTAQMRELLGTMLKSGRTKEAINLLVRWRLANNAAEGSPREEQ